MTQTTTVTNGTISTGSTTTVGHWGTGDYWWWQGIYPTVWHYPLTWTPMCGTDNHDFMQAKSPYEGLLFCRKCGEGKQLRKGRAR